MTFLCLQIVDSFEMTYDHMERMTPKHRRLLANSVRHQRIVARALLGIAASSMRESHQRTAFFYNVSSTETPRARPFVCLFVCVRTYTRLSQSAFVRFLFNLVLCVDA